MSILSAPSTSSSINKRKKNTVKEIAVCIINFKDTSDKTFTYISNLTNPEERFSKIKEVCTLQQSQHLGSNKRMNDACKNIPDFLKKKNMDTTRCATKDL